MIIPLSRSVGASFYRAPLVVSRAYQMQEPLNNRAQMGSQAWDSEDWQEFFAEEARPGGRVGEHRQAPGEPAQPLRPLGAVLSTARCRAVLAEVLSACGQHAQAQEMYESGIAAVENFAGPKHPQAGRSLSGLAGLYLGLARYSDAVPLLDKA